MARNTAFLPDHMQRHTIGQACRALQACLEAQTDAEKAFRAGLGAIFRETDLAIRSAGDGDVEAFAAWLRQGRARVERARIGVGTAASQVASARAALNLARAAALSTAGRISGRDDRAGATGRQPVRVAPEGSG